jgi:hypothetical protein
MFASLFREAQAFHLPPPFGGPAVVYPTLRVTQDTLESLLHGTQNLLVTQDSADELIKATPSLRISQASSDELIKVALNLRVSQNTIEILLKVGPLPPPPPPSNNTSPLPPHAQGPSKGILLNLDRQVFEPIQAFADIIRAIGREVTGSGTRWLDLTNGWSTYNVPWNSFPAQNNLALMLGTQGLPAVLWQDLTNGWSTYNVPWNSFPGGGQVHIFSANSPNDHGVAIPYFYVPALFVGNDRQTILLDGWDFYFRASSKLELATIEFAGLTMPKALAMPITDSLVDLSDDRTYAIPKALPSQNKYNRYIRLRFSGSSFYRAFRFGGGTVFVQSQERPSA